MSGKKICHIFNSCRRQLRYLQTLNNICGEKNSIVIFPLPVEFLTPLLIPSLCGHQETVQMAEYLHKAEDKY